MKRNNQLFPSIFDEFFRNELANMTPQLSMPQVNIKETDTAYLLEVVAPGRQKEDFSLEVDNDMLTISSEIKRENEEKDGKYTRKEFVATSFKRSFSLPDTVEEEGIKAGYVNGVLHIELPKKAVALPKAKKQILIG